MKTLEQTIADVNEMKKDLRKEGIDGKFMIRRDMKYRGLDLQGLYSFIVYYDTPTSGNRRIIKEVIEARGYTAFNMQVIGGAYGYVIRFRTPS